ncbi:hypothetical protein REPUB_Repub10bG0082600 [Reevesia pubescens]
MVSVEEKAAVTDGMDFDKLMPYSSLPKEGHLIAYRLLELSSSWTPKLCSFRVGKIAHYDAKSNKIMLTLVPEYPNASEKKIDEEASELPDTSIYGGDSSLEKANKRNIFFVCLQIDYSSVIDVCLIKHDNSNTIIAVVDGNNENCAKNQYVLTSRGPNGSNEPALLSAAPLA